MKKTLIALAAVAVSTGAMAQAHNQATISGVVDFSAVSNGKTTTGTSSTATLVNTNVKTSSTGTQNGWTTSAITFRASEDLGGGLKATATVTSQLTDGAFTARDQHINVSGGFGSVQIGRFDPAAASGQHGFAGTRTANTAGAIYAFSGAGSATSNFFAAASATTLQRKNGIIQYTSPSFNGVTVTANHSNTSSDETGGNAANILAKAGKATGKQNGLNIAYSAGPLRIGVGMTKGNATTEAAVADIVTTKDDHNYMGASYNFGAATVFATQAKRKNTTQTGTNATVNAVDAKVTAYGVQVPMGAITLAASTYSGKDKRVGTAAAATKLSGNQISVTYALSKRTQIYAVSGTAEIKRDGAASRIDTRKVSQTNIGLTHSF